MTITTITIATLLVVITSGIFTIRKRKKLKQKSDWKSTVTPVCFHLSPLIALMAYFGGWMGMISWMLLGVLFLTAAAFTKHLPQPEKNENLFT